MAPILSFTAEEIWQHIPGKKSESIFLEEWYQGWPDNVIADKNKWAKIQEVRSVVNKALEEARQEGIIGSGLAAKVTIYGNDEVLSILNQLEGELRFVLITSEAKLLPASDLDKPELISEEGLYVEVAASDNEKCQRCWHRVADVGQDNQYPDLCIRCAGNISGHPEKREYA